MEQMILAQAMSYVLHPGLLLAYAPAMLLLMYLFASWDARRDGSASAGDTQIGLKVAVHVFAIVAILIAAGGVQGILNFILGKMKGGASSVVIKMAIGNLIAGGGAFFGCMALLLPRTNCKEHDKITRMSYGIVAFLSGVIAIVSLAGFLSGVIGGAPWQMNYPMLSALIVFGALGFLTLSRLGTLSGWVAPPPKAAGFPPQGGGYDPNAYAQQQQPQQGYPPQGGGYPPQGGTPPAGGYPPPGGAPPAGGGYPPQGGGGLPPPAGGGYPPAGGGY